MFCLRHLSNSGASSPLTRIELKNEDGDQAKVEAEGSVIGLDTGSITIQSNEGEDRGSVTFTIPDGFILPDGLALGSLVDARGALVSGIATLTEIEGGSSGSSSTSAGQTTIGRRSRWGRRSPPTARHAAGRADRWTIVGIHVMSIPGAPGPLFRNDP